MNAWDRFWFTPMSVASVARTRAMCCALAVCYFLSCWGDAAFWYGPDGLLSNDRVATFLDVGGLQDASRWILSPLFLTDSVLAYRVYLLIGCGIAAMVALGRGRAWTGWALWIVFVGCANRALLLAGFAETLLSMALFCVAMAPAESFLRSSTASHWQAGFAHRLLGIHATFIAAVTFMTMLGGRVWWNGLGSYALVAPAEDRWIDWTQGVFVSPWVYEPTTHFMVFALPIGVALAWTARWNRWGRGLLCIWAAAVALLGSHFLYAATFAVMASAIRPCANDPPEVSR